MSPRAPALDLSLTELDREIDVGFRAPEELDSDAAAPWDDQATQLRALANAARAGEEPTEPVDCSDARRIDINDDLEQSPAVECAAPDTRPRAPAICIASGKGGVGKTSVAVNLSIALANLGVRTTLLDADLGTANADLLCGITPHARLDHVITPLPVHDGARRSLADIAIPAPGGFRLVPGSAGIARMADLSPTEQRRLMLALDQLEREADALIIDAAAGIGRSVTAFVESADLCLLVTTPEPTAIADAYALVKCLASRQSEQASHDQRRLQKENGLLSDALLLDAHSTAGSDSRTLPRIALIVNQTQHDDEARSVYARFRAACERFLGVQIDFAASIAQDLRVAEAVRARKPLMIRSPSSIAARNMQVLAQRVAQQMALSAERGVAAAPCSLVTRLARLLRR